jgi:hypothetical protein
MFTFQLVLEDGTPADPPQFVTAVPNWAPGQAFLLHPGRVMRTLAIEAADEEEQPHATWTVERVT